MKRSHSLNRTSRLHRVFRRIMDIALALVLLGLVALVAAGAQKNASLEVRGAARVVDGDTLRVAGERIRLRGIDAPELDQICRKDGAAYACGKTARAALGRLIDDQDVRCGGWERDRYRRLLAVCHAGGTEINAAMVSAGWAVAYGAYASQETDARLAGRGLWAGAFERPQAWRVSRGQAGGRPHDLLSAAVHWLRQILFDRGAPTLQE